MLTNNNELDEQNLVGKVVSFSSDENILAIRNLRFEIQHDRLFAIGEVAKGSTINDWAMGRKCAIAWDAVTDYMIFDSEEQYVKSLAISDWQKS